MRWPTTEISTALGRRIGAGAFAAVAAIGLAGCAGAVSNGPWPDPSGLDRLILRPGDQVEIRFESHPEFNDAGGAMPVRADGRISVPFLGDVQAAGLTPVELDRRITEALSEELENHSVTVVVRSQPLRRVYVAGEVRLPGVIEMPGALSLGEAVLQAGGFDMRSAKPSRVLIVRYVGGKRHQLVINMDFEQVADEANKEFLGDVNLALAPGDMIYVPRTRIARVNHWVEQFINRMIPSIRIVGVN
jgi:protein involved in polysaccharide export with SLBB domain